MPYIAWRKDKSNYVVGIYSLREFAEAASNDVWNLWDWEYPFFLVELIGGKDNYFLPWRTKEMALQFIGTRPATLYTIPGVWMPDLGEGDQMGALEHEHLHAGGLHRYKDTVTDEEAEAFVLDAFRAFRKLVQEGTLPDLSRIVLYVDASGYTEHNAQPGEERSAVKLPVIRPHCVFEGCLYSELE